MFTLDKLKNMSILIDNATVDGELATYFVNNLSNLSTMTLQKCIKDTGISKASIHRFYSKAGFINFKNFVSVLKEEVNAQSHIDFCAYTSKINYLINEYDFSYVKDTNLIEKLVKADQILIYAHIGDMYNLGSSIGLLRKANKKVISLNMWDIQQNYEKFEHMSENDVLVIINNSMNLQNFHEQSINNEYLINIEKIKKQKINRFYIGQGNQEDYLEFKIVKMPDYGVELSFIVMNLLDKYIYQELLEEL